jgi:sugar/nucleoside kinase (ribokinase family)
MTAAPRPPDVVVVGAASRDLARDDPRGWRLGGGVCYSALTTARLGLATAALVGVDELAARAPELDLLRQEGVDVHLVHLERGPVFDNVEGPAGRRQVAHEVADPVDSQATPRAWLGAPGWILAPVAVELPDAWAGVPPAEAFVALGWQGLLRELVPGEVVRRVPPAPHALLERADLVGVGRDDVEPGTRLEDLYAAVRPGATLVLTHGERGGLVADRREDGTSRLRRYPAVPSRVVVDPTGAGDVLLATLAAVRVEPRLVGGRTGRGLDLLIAAAAASLVVERPGLLGVADHRTVRRRAAEARR